MAHMCRCGLPALLPYDFCVRCGPQPPPTRKLVAIIPDPPGRPLLQEVLISPFVQDWVPHNRPSLAMAPQLTCPCLVPRAMTSPSSSHACGDVATTAEVVMPISIPVLPTPPSRPPPAVVWEPYIIATDVVYPLQHHQEIERRKNLLAGVIKKLFWDTNVVYGHFDTELARCNITNISLVVCLHPFCCWDAASQRARALAELEQMDPVTFLIHAAAQNWRSASILAQARSNLLDREHMERIGFEMYDAATAWPIINGCTYNPQKFDGRRLRNARDMICYRSAQRGPHKGIFLYDSRNFDLVTLFRNARLQGTILIFAAWDLEIVEVIHAYVTHDY